MLLFPSFHQENRPLGAVLLSGCRATRRSPPPLASAAAAAAAAPGPALSVSWGDGSRDFWLAARTDDELVPWEEAFAACGGIRDEVMAMLNSLLQI